MWADGASLPTPSYDRLGATVDNKRLGHVLAITAQVQAERDSRQQAGPSRTLQGEPARPHRAPPNVKRRDLERAIAAAPFQQNGTF
ncbi:hypothetical protein [Cupriavidus sp. H39]|uniref:hypothetical protein n=1 Tax=Cupriavidus sp. H39 TaxID=3401635 RepID=UPI003D019411